MALQDQAPLPGRVWNQIPDTVRDRLITLALNRPELSPRELAVTFTDTQGYFVCESSVYRLLKAHDLITSAAFIVIKAASEFTDKTTAINQQWQTDFTYLKIIGWGWMYLSTILDDFSRYVVAWKLCTTMTSRDVAETLQLALQASGCDQADLVHKPRLLSDNGSSYLSNDLADWLSDNGMSHVRGAPYHPQTQGKIERWHQTLKNRILLENYFLPGDLEQQIEMFVNHYNHRRYHESLNNLTPADVYFGRGQSILAKRDRIKRKTIAKRRLHYQRHAAQHENDEQNTPLARPNICPICLKTDTTPRLLCSLVHKFGRKDVDDLDAFVKELKDQPSQTVGEVFVFVDECHRTQSGTLHRVMKAIMPNAVFIGFTGTPLLTKDRKTSLEIFGNYIHTYKFSEGVEDGVVLDLIYEAREIEQRLGSEDKIDAWFDAKTKGLNDWQKDELKKQWGTMQNVLSSKSRIDKVVSDIVFDFSVKPRLSNARGNAILVASSIFEACKYFELFQKTPLKDKCAVITSYNPIAGHVTLEETGANTETEKQFIYNTYTELLEDVEAKPGMNPTETYEERAKELFITEPANMKLLVVVDKLLTGFDAPPCTYLYIDKSMQDHGLFQAICRTNRLDAEDKDFGYIVDYKDLFKKVENAIAVYTAELDHSAGGSEPDILLQDRLKKGKERLDNALEALALLCEPVVPPKGELEYIHYFCGNTEIPEDLKKREPQRAALYKSTVAFVRACANIADELEAAEYDDASIARIKDQLGHHLNVREIIRMASGETIDLKAYEADMRHLIDTYIEADEPRKISPFDNMSLLELIEKTGIADTIQTQLGSIKGNKNAIAETIENNVRAKIIKEHLTDPAFYEKMSALLDEIIAARKAKAEDYEEYLKKIAELAKKVGGGKADDTPTTLNTPGKRALWNNLRQDEALAIKIDEVVKKTRPDGWRGVLAREQVIKRALYEVLNDVEETKRIFLIIKAQNEY